MIRFVQFLKRIYVFLLFVVLEAFCFQYYASSTAYTKAKLLTVSNRFVGGIYQGISDVGHYFSLGAENRELTRQLADLHNRLALYQADTTAQSIHLSGDIATYQYMAARVVGNSVSKQENFLTLNRGLRDDVEADMAVVSPGGMIVGYVMACSDKYSACISVLNTSFKTSGKFKKADYVGSVYWDGKNTGKLMLTDIPRYAEISRGDTIVTSNYSAIFPPGVLIGTVDEWSLNDQTYCYDIKIDLMTPISSLREVMLVRYMDAAERSTLEQSAGY